MHLRKTAQVGSKNVRTGKNDPHDLVRESRQHQKRDTRFFGSASTTCRFTVYSWFGFDKDSEDERFIRGEFSSNSSLGPAALVSGRSDDLDYGSASGPGIGGAAARARCSDYLGRTRPSGAAADIGAFEWPD